MNYANASSSFIDVRRQIHFSLHKYDGFSAGTETHCLPLLYLPLSRRHRTVTSQEPAGFF